MGRRVSKAIVCIALICSSMAVAQDKPLPNYHKTTGIVGNLLSVGSDTLAGMTTLWWKSLNPFTRTSTRKFKLQARQRRHLL